MNNFFAKCGNDIRCLLCPNNCLLKENKYGKCGAWLSIGNKAVQLTYGIMSSITVESIEKKPFFHFFPGSKVLSIGSFGCNLCCGACENYHISQLDKNALNNSLSHYYHPDEIVQLALKHQVFGIVMTYNEPCIQYDYLMDLSDECCRNDLFFMIKTNAYVNRLPWENICSVCDAINIDYKGSPSKYIEMCSAVGNGELVVLERIKDAYISGKHLEISIPVRSDLGDLSEYDTIISFLSNLDNNIPVHLLKMWPTDICLFKPVSDGFILRLEKYFRSKMNFVYSHSVAGGTLNTYCPFCNNMLISRPPIFRRGYNIDFNLCNCSKCGADLYGIFHGQ